MKKLFLLLPVAALAACNGGSGGGGGSDSGTHVSRAAIISNKKVTSMASEILVANGSSPNLTRSGTVTDDGGEYIAYHLDNAKFLDNHMDPDEYISFGINDANGQIDSILYHYTEGGQDMVETINRESADNNVFTENVYKFHVTVGGNTYYTDSLVPGQYSKDQIKEAFRDAYQGEPGITDEILSDIIAAVDATDMEPTEYLQRHVVDLQGKDMPDSNKLRYSDFGYTTILEKEIYQEGDGVGDDNNLIFGGYEVKEIANPEDLQSVTFTGKAVAALGNIHHNANTRIETDATATTLEFNADGDQILTMPFNGYYTITVNKPHDGNDHTISWTGDTAVGYALDNVQPITNPDVAIKYYGDNDNPSEAVGGVTFQNNNVEFNGAFGVKK